MRFRKGTVLTLVAPALLALSAPALGETTIDTELQVTVAKGTKFVVQADVTMSNSGVVTLTGTAGSKQFSFTKKFKTRAGRAKSKTVKFTVDPKKLGLRDLTDSLILRAGLSAKEGGEAEPVTVLGGAALPPPLMIVPGLGNELPPDQFKLIYNPFRDALNENGGGVWLAKGKRATIRTQKYFSTSFPIEQLGAALAKQGAKMLKKSRLFARMDFIGQSTGGLVIRQAMVPITGAKGRRPVSLAGKVRQAFFMGTPQSGTPIAFLARQALIGTMDLPNGVRERALEEIQDSLVASVDSPTAASLAALLLRPARKQGQTPPFLGVVDLFLPTYPFATIPVGANATATIDLPTLTGLSGTPLIPILAGLNGVAPDPNTTYYALYYSDVAEATGDVRSVDGLDMIAFVAGGSSDSSLIRSVNGAGDGLATRTSTLMTAHPAWNAVLQPLDLGPGLHSIDPLRPTLPAYYNDPNVLGFILPRLLSPTTVSKQ